MKILHNFIPFNYQSIFKQIFNINSYIEFVKQPNKWLKQYNHKLINLIFKICSYFFQKPILKWIDYNVVGWLNFFQAKAIYNIGRGLLNNSVIVEIGAYKGKSTCFISEAIKTKKNIEFYSIDTFNSEGLSVNPENRSTYKEYLINTLPYRKEISTLKGYSYNIIDLLKNKKVDLLWIDGDHSYEGVKQDIKDWLPLVPNGGFVIFHDYRKWPTYGVKEVVDENIKDNKLGVIKKIGMTLITKKLGK